MDVGRRLCLLRPRRLPAWSTSPHALGEPMLLVLGVRQRCHSATLTPKEVADALDLDRHTVSKYLTRLADSERIAQARPRGL